jgi:hypothetical protein
MTAATLAALGQGHVGFFNVLEGRHDAPVNINTSRSSALAASKSSTATSRYIIWVRRCPIANDGASRAGASTITRCASSS